MSVVVKARPYSLISDFISIFTVINHDEKQAIESFHAISAQVKNIMEPDEKIKADDNLIQDEAAKDVIDIICKEYKTVFVNNEVLLKTLDEHGFENIVSDDDNISCEMDVFKIEFYRNPELRENGEKEPYTMKISSACSDNDIMTLINDINAEYTYNSQEENYIKIKERLEKRGFKINEEEVYDDDTIVLTVNIE